MKEKRTMDAKETVKESGQAERTRYQKPVVTTYSEAELAEKQLTVHAGSLINP